MKPIHLPTVADSGNYDAIDPLDGRYYDPEIAQYLSERTRIAYQAYVEAALAHTLADFGVCSHEVANEIENATAQITAEAVQAEEKVTKHDVKALGNCLKEYVSDAAKPYVHFGATSYDIVVPASSLQLRDALQQVVIPRLKALTLTLAKLTEEYAETLQVGRTHGQHAVPITFGFALAGYTNRLGENVLALEDLTKALPGKFSGAVGAYNALSMFVDDPMEFERKLLEKVGLPVAAYSTQIVPAEYTVRIIDELAVSAGIMANLSHDMRHLQRSEIAEVREKFEPGQTGSSTMAHKRNPWNFENVVSMSKQVNAQLVNAQLNLPSEHQRDLTDSASARFYLIVPALVASMAKRLDGILQKIEVDADNMKRNLLMSEGAIAAEPLYLLFAKHGHTQAHEKSKALAHEALSKGVPLVTVIEADPEALEYWQKFSDSEQKIIVAPEMHYTGLAAEKAKLLAGKWQQQFAA